MEGDSAGRTHCGVRPNEPEGIAHARAIEIDEDQDQKTKPQNTEYQQYRWKMAKHTGEEADVQYERENDESASHKPCPALQVPERNTNPAAEHHHDNEVGGYDSWKIQQERRSQLGGWRCVFDKPDY